MLQFPRYMFKSRNGKKISGNIIVGSQSDFDARLEEGWFPSNPEALVAASKELAVKAPAKLGRSAKVVK